MRNEKINQKGDTNVEYGDFISTRAGVSDSNKNWDDYQLYYDESDFRGDEIKDVSPAELMRIRNFGRGQRILAALRGETDRAIRAEKHAMRAA